MELRRYIDLLGRWWWLFITCIFAAGSVAYFLTPEPEPTYKAMVLVQLSQGEEALPDVDDVTRGQRLADTYGELMRTRAVLDEVIANLSLETNPESLARTITVSNIEGTNLLRITVERFEPVEAADIANEIVRVFIDRNLASETSRYETLRGDLTVEIAQVLADIEAQTTQLYVLQSAAQVLEGRLSELDATAASSTLTPAEEGERLQVNAELSQNRTEQNRLGTEIQQLQIQYEAKVTQLEEIRLLDVQSAAFMSISEEALPGSPAPPPLTRQVNAVQAMAGGAMIALVAVAVMENLRVAVQSTEDVEAVTGLPTLGVIASIKADTPADTLVTAHQPRSPASESYRILRTNLEFAFGSAPPSTIVVTSGSPQEGKTVTAANLAVTLADSGKRVVLVDVDLRRPAMHRLFEQSNTRGVTTALLQPDHDMLIGHAIQSGIDNLFLLPSGPLPPNPADLLGSERMDRLIKQLSENADVVVFDTPPLLVVADAVLVARRCEATLLVVRAEVTNAGLLKKTRAQITQASINVVGTVLNRVSSSKGGYYNYYHYYG